MFYKKRKAKACFNGHLELAQWLLLIKPTIDISVDLDCAFRFACINGHLRLAQWLLQVSKERCQLIDISVKNEQAFRWACECGHLEVAQWLQSLKPYLYIIYYDENGKIKSYRIREEIIRIPNIDKYTQQIINGELILSPKEEQISHEKKLNT
jgi:ankyrin repeat protein